ncbi:MAG: hypothetical protein Q8L07_04275 [Sediminibacterium sp.]|nr:hypothetical protein [Sediminibacterium sp.]
MSSIYTSSGMGRQPKGMTLITTFISAGTPDGTVINYPGIVGKKGVILELDGVGITTLTGTGSRSFSYNLTTGDVTLPLIAATEVVAIYAY